MNTPTSEPCDTPLMRQYFAIKNNYRDALLLFQVGDFYELFFDDAKKASQFLGITLTSRGKHKGESIPLCGVPVHALDHYLAKLVRGGFRVALCDQLNEPIPGKVVERGVTQVLTPGTLTDAKLLDEKSASYILAFHPTQTHWGLVFGELMTGQLFGTVLTADSDRAIEAELARFFPAEIVVPDTTDNKKFQRTFRSLDYFVSPMQSDEQINQEASNWIARFSSLQTQDDRKRQALYCALQTFYAYMKKTQHTSLDQFSSLQLYQPDDFLLMDAATQRNLELVRNSKDGSIKHTLFWVLDGAVTPMGSRMIKKWIMRPLIKQEAIQQRQQVVQLLINDVMTSQELIHALRGVGDLERIVGRIALNKARIYDYLTLAHALAHIPTLRAFVNQHASLPLMTVMSVHIDDFTALHKLLIAALHDDSSSDWAIRPGFDQQLDYLRDLANNGHNKILALEQQEQAATGIGSLKVRYNQVQGYYIEVTKTHSDTVPARYIRSQTLAGRERFTTSELQHLQQQLLYAQAEAVSLEKVVFDRIKQETMQYSARLRKLAYALAHLDALVGFAQVAAMGRYVCPVINERNEVMIEQGRHPVVERTLDCMFIPNDTQLNDRQSLHIVTGPNMGGKSTYLRQVALISIMAQCGSFVPAVYTSVPLFDRIFTRIGAGDNLAEGKSTFLVEMEETAAICTGATHKSLVILDEVGRGTSTFDGLAIAQAVVEYIHTYVKARCLFATHYHELTHLEGQLSGLACYHAASSKTEQGVLLLHKIIAGNAQGSFGIEVAKRTALPEIVIRRAQELMPLLAQSTGTKENYLPAGVTSLSLHETIRILEEKVRACEHIISLVKDVERDDLSPRQAFELIYRMKDILK